MCVCVMWGQCVCVCVCMCVCIMWGLIPAVLSRPQATLSSVVCVCVCVCRRERICMSVYTSVYLCVSNHITLWSTSSLMTDGLCRCVCVCVCVCTGACMRMNF